MTESVSVVFARAIIGAMLTSEEEICHVTAQLLNGTPTLNGVTPGISLHVLNPMLTHLQLSKGDDIGLQAYNAAHPGHLGALGYAMMSSPTVHWALTRIAEYHATISAGFCLFLDEKQGTLRIAGLPVNTDAEGLHRVFEDAVLSITLGLLHWLTPGAHIMPTLTEFSYKKPEDTTQLEKRFGQNLVFSSPVTALTFQRTDADQPIITSDLALHHLHCDFLQKNLELTVGSVSSLIMSAIVQRLDRSEPLLMAAIAKAVNFSLHQMTRALESEGKSFQKLVDAAREQRSRYLLNNTTLSFKQVAYLVGFKNQSSFNKASERWFGMSPGRYRSAAHVFSTPTPALAEPLTRLAEPPCSVADVLLKPARGCESR